MPLDMGSLYAARTICELDSRIDALGRHGMIAIHRSVLRKMLFERAR